MDPNEILNDIEKIIKDFKPFGSPNIEELSRLVYLVNDLNKWILNGGFLPEKWKKGLKELKR